LENERGGYLVYDAAVLLAGAAGFIENLVGFAAGQALVPQVDGQASQLSQLSGKGLGFGGLGAQFAGQMHGIAHYDAGDLIAAGQAGEGTQIVALVAAPLEGEHRLSREPEFVADSHADAAIADVEREIAGMGGGLQVLAPGFLTA
jgi:hypothetical protein